MWVPPSWIERCLSGFNFVMRLGTFLKCLMNNHFVAKSFEFAPTLCTYLLRTLTHCSFFFYPKWFIRDITLRGLVHCIDLQQPQSRPQWNTSFYFLNNCMLKQTWNPTWGYYKWNMTLNMFSTHVLHRIQS